VTARTEAKKVIREAKIKKLAAKTESVAKELGTKLYGVLHVDPPWKFEVY
jgi:hypothetical protein